MSDLILAAYASHRPAFAAGEALAALQAETGVDREDIVVVTRSGPGRVSLNQGIDVATGQPLGGGQWGALIGMLFLDPRRPTGQGQGLAEQLLASGLAADFLGEVVKSLTPKAAVVGLRVRKLGVDRVRARLEALPGRPKILQARLTPDTEDALRELQDQIPHGVLQQPDGMI